MSYSNGFKKQASSMASSAGFKQTVKREHDWQNSSQLSKTQKFPDSIQAKAIKQVQINHEKKISLMNYLDQNAMNTDFSYKPESRIENNQDPFDQRIRSKTMNLLITEENNGAKKPPGTLTLKASKNGVTRPKFRRSTDPVIVIQALVRRFLARVKYIRKLKSYRQMISVNKKNKDQKRLIKNDLNSGSSIAEQLERQKREREKRLYHQQDGVLGMDKENPFYTTCLEILGEKGVLEQDDFVRAHKFDEPESQPKMITRPKVAKLRPQTNQGKIKPKQLNLELPNDGVGIFAVYFKKTIGKVPSVDQQIMESNLEYEDDFEETQKTEIQDKKKLKIKSLLDRQVPQTKYQAVTTKGVKKKSSDDIEEEILESGSKVEIDENINESIEEYLEEEFENGSSEEVKESIPKESIQESYPQERIQESIPKESIKESYPNESLPQESIPQESINEDIKDSGLLESFAVKEKTDKNSYYDDDFEQESNQVKSSSYQDEKFESFSGEHSRVKPKSVTFDQSADKQLLQPYPTPSKPLKPKFVEEDRSEYLRAKEEAEFVLARTKEKFRELREMKLGDFSELEKEHYQFRKVEEDVNKLLRNTKDYYKDWKSSGVGGEAPKGGSADYLYSKFQFEFQRLLTVNNLGTRFGNILGTVFSGGKGGGQAQSVPMASLQSVLHSIEQQQQVVQQVLTSVLQHLQEWFSGQSTVNELKQYRQESDQKLQQLLFKQDKLLNQRMESELKERDQSLRKFILEQFEKQRRELGSVKVAPSLKSALNKNLSQESHLQQAQKFEQSSSYKKSMREDSEYQPDFDDDTSQQQSQRVKTDDSAHFGSSQSKLSNSLSVDREIDELVASSEVDWQHDINLFDNRAEAKGDYKQHLVVDYIAQMLLQEIKQDLFPHRDGFEEKVHTQSSVERTEDDELLRSNESETVSLQQDKPADHEPEAQKPISQFEIKKKEEAPEEDLMGGPSFSRHELEQEFDLSGMNEIQAQQKLQESIVQKKPDLVKNQNMDLVKEILDKYGKKTMTKMQSLVIQTFLKIMSSKQSSKQTIGYLMQTQFRFFPKSEVWEENGLPIVQAFEEQLGNALLKFYNEQPKQSLDKFEESMRKSFKQHVHTAQAAVLKQCELLVPVDYCNDAKKQASFDEVYKYSQKNKVAKDCVDNYEVQEYYLKQMQEQLGTQAYDKILKNIIKESMDEFNQINQTRVQKRK